METAVLERIEEEDDLVGEDAYDQLVARMWDEGGFTAAETDAMVLLFTKLGFDAKHLATRSASEYPELHERNSRVYAAVMKAVPHGSDAEPGSLHELLNRVVSYKIGEPAETAHTEGEVPGEPACAMTTTRLVGIDSVDG